MRTRFIQCQKAFPEMLHKATFKHILTSQSELYLTDLIDFSLKRLKLSRDTFSVIIRINIHKVRRKYHPFHATFL